MKRTRYHSNPYYQCAKTMLDECGVDDIVEEQRRCGHLKLRWMGRDGRRYSIPITGSPSDSAHGLGNFRSQLRRRLAEGGLLPKH